jgi:hypothetical protein
VTKEIETLGDRLQQNKIMHQHEYENSLADYRYFQNQRDDLNIRIRFGLVTLNAGSLIALISVFGGEGKAADWIGLTQKSGSFAALMFIIGLLLAGWSVSRQQSLAQVETIHANAAVKNLSMLIASYEKIASIENLEKQEEISSRLHRAPLVGFKFSIIGIYAQNFSACFWFLGLVVPISKALNFTMLNLKSWIAF